MLTANLQEVVTSGCAGRTDSGPGVMGCLMDLAAADSNHMTQECKVTVMEIAYFMARDFELNPKLYKYVKCCFAL